MERLLQDLRFAGRLLWKDRSFSLTTIATLALCLAANVAIFAVVNGVLLKPLPFPEPDRLVRFFNKYPGAGVETGGSNGVPDYFDRKRDMAALEETALFREAGVTISGSGLAEAERVEAMFVTPSFFRVIGTQPYRGQLFSEEQGELGQEKVVILSHGSWQRLFGGRDDAIGQDIRLGGEPYKVVGVLAPEFVFLNPDLQLFRPAAFTARDKSDETRHNNNWQQIGRLKAGATLQQAQSQLDAINAANFERFPKWQEILKNARFGSDVVDFQSDLIGERKSTLTMLWGGAIFVLLIGCVNVANLVLVRSTSRIRELATRHAMGATFGRLSRQALTESLVLSIAGGLAGLGLGWWALQAAPFFGFDRLPSGVALSLDAQVVGFTHPADHHGRPRRRHDSRGRDAPRQHGAGDSRGRPQRHAGPRTEADAPRAGHQPGGVCLDVADRRRGVAGELRSHPDDRSRLSRRQRVDRHHQLAGVALCRQQRTARGQRRASSIACARSPGVVGAGVTTTLPFSGSYSDSVILAEGYQMQPGESLISPGQVTVSDGYFEAMGATLLSGRLFTADDTDGRPRVLVIDDRLARRFWPKGDARRQADVLSRRTSATPWPSRRKSR